MPSLDVSRVLASPRFADAATVTRTTVTVDPATGRTVKATADQIISVVVTSDKGQNLRRTPDAASSTGSILMHSTFCFTEGGDGLDADIVTWQAKRWTVVAVDDYSRYGAGFTAATCRLLDLR